MTTAGKRKNSPMAPYFVQLREFERRLMRDAIEAGGDVSTAARMLGVTQHYVKARAKLLGGVIGDEPKHEPPGRAADAWNGTLRSAPDRRRARAAAEAAAMAPSPTPKASINDPRCGSQGVDDEGHCLRCGLFPDSDHGAHCPPGFLKTHDETLNA